MHSENARLARFLTLWYGWCVAHQFIVLYPVFLLMMADAGLEPEALAVLLVVWTGTAFLLDVPTGAIADRFPRHRVLALGLAVKGAGFVAWAVAPTFWGFLAGFVLWGAGSSLASGTREAVLYDHLARADRQHEFQRCWGRSRALMVGAGTAAAALGGALAEAGYLLPVGLSILVILASAVVPLATFACPPAAATDGEAADSFGALLRRGALEVLHTPTLRTLVLAIAATIGIVNAFEEFTPLLLRERGAGLTAVGVLFAVIYVGFVIGSVLSERLLPAAPEGGSKAPVTGPLCWAAGGGALLVVAGAIDGPAGLLALGAAYFAWGVYDIALGARLQHAMTGNARATVTSVAGAGQTATNQLTYLGLGTIAGGADWSAATVTAGAALALAAALLLAFGRRR